MNESLTTSLGNAFARAMHVIGEYMPNALAAVVILLLGWVVAVLLRNLTSYLAKRAQESLDRIKWLQVRTQQVRAYRVAPALLSRCVFWIVLLFFLVAAVEALGLPAVSNLLGRLTTYVPRVLAAALILLVGLLAGDVVLGLLSRALTEMGIAYSKAVARTAQVLIVVVAAIVAVEHLGVNSTVLTLVFSIIAGTTLGAAALAFGLGARSTVANMLGVQQVALLYQVGDTVRLGATEGRIVEITQTTVVVEGAGGKMVIPGQRFSDKVSARVGASD